MCSCRGCRASAARRALQESDLHEVWLDHVDEGRFFLTQTRGERSDPNRAAIVLPDERVEKCAIERIETEQVNAFEFERRLRDRAIDRAAGFDFREIAHAAQETVGDARRAARSGGDLAPAVAPKHYPQDVC